MRFLLVCSLLIGLSSAYPTGAPNEICQDITLTPQHGKDPQDNKKIPYRITVSKNYYTNEKDEIKVTIKGKAKDTKIQGFAVGILSQDEKQWIGLWKEDNITHMVEACPVATHNNKTHKSEVKLTWYAPKNPSGTPYEVKIKVTALQTGYTYWVNSPLEILDKKGQTTARRTNPTLFRRQF